MTMQLPLFDETPSSDTRPLPEIIASDNRFALAYHDTPDGRFYSVQDWLVGVAKTDNPSDYWGKMKKRFKKDGFQLSTPCLQLPYISTDGKRYKLDHATDIVLYQITQRMDTNTGIRNKILDYLAKAGVKLDEFRRDPEAFLNAAEKYYIQEQMRRYGLTEAQAVKALKSRRDGKEDFKRLMAAIDKVSIDTPNYPAVVDTEYLYLFGYITKRLKVILDTDSIRDAMPSMQYAYVRAAETTLEEIFKHSEGLAQSEIIELARKACEPLGKMLRGVCEMLRIDIVTGKPLLGNGQD